MLTIQIYTHNRSLFLTNQHFWHETKSISSPFLRVFYAMYAVLGGTPTYDFAKFPQKTTWNWKNVDPMGALASPSDPPLVCNIIMLPICTRIPSDNRLQPELCKSKGRPTRCKSFIYLIESLAVQQKQNTVTIVGKCLPNFFTPEL